MKAPEGEKKRELITVLKNGMAIFTETSKSELGIYCQNVLTEEAFLIDKSLSQPKPKVSAVCSYDGITIKILVKFKDSAEATLFCVTVNDGKISESLDIKEVSVTKDLMPVDNSGSGGLFHFIHGHEWGKGIIDIASQFAKPHYLHEHDEPTHRFQNANLYALADGLICIGHYYQCNSSETPFFKSLFGIHFGSSYLKLYDTKEFKCLHQLKINGTVHVVAVSPSRQFLAMSIESGKYFGKPLEDQHYNKFLCPIEIWDLSQGPKKIRTVRYDAETRFRKSDEYREGSIASMSLSDAGNLAFVVSRYRPQIYYYSFSENKVWNTLLDNIRFEREYFHPSYFLDGDQMLFADMNSFFVCKIDHAASKWILEKCIDVNNIQLSAPIKEKSKPAVSLPASKNKTQRDKPLPNMEFFTITRGHPVVDNEEDSPGQVAQALSSARPVLVATAPQKNSERAQLNPARFAEKAKAPGGAPSSSAVVPGTTQAKLVISDQVREEQLSNVSPEESRFIEYGEFKEPKKIKENDTHIIYTASWKAKVVALKVIKTAGDSETNKKCLEREFNNLKATSHPRIIRTLGHSLVESNNFCLVLHYYPHGDLGQYIYKPGEWNNQKAWRYRCVVEVCEALDYLHSQNPPLIHLDIKPENVFLDENWHAVLGDFGLSVVLPKNKSHQSTSSGGKGTDEFKAPELHQIPDEGQQNAYRPSCDVYSLAVSMWCCETQKMPFANLRGGSIAVYVTQSGREKIPTETPPKLAALIQSCWAHEPRKRPVISKVFKKMTDIYTEELQNSGGIVSEPKAFRK